MSWQLPSSKERTMCERSEMQFGAEARERRAKVKKQFGPRQKESSENSTLKVESHKTKALVAKRREVKAKKQRRRAGVEQ